MPGSRPRPLKNSERLRHLLSFVYASATRAGSRLFQASSAARAFRAADSASKGGKGGGPCGLRLLRAVLDDGEVDLRAGDRVHVVGERVERDVEHDLHHLHIVVAGGLRTRCSAPTTRARLSSGSPGTRALLFLAGAGIRCVACGALIIASSARYERMSTSLIRTPPRSPGGSRRDPRRRRRGPCHCPTS